jgi:hypothetical protein
MMHPTSARRRSRQSGSALLIVFVFAAMIAIMLYKEMPVVAFEARRQKEQLLIDRGNEYKRAVKLYVRKFQTFPPSIEALENTNRMRFLRSRYVDPFSGKDDWRLLHAGPGGIIIDSKLKTNVLGSGGVPGAPGTPTSPTTSAASASSFGTPFGSSSGFGTSAGFGNPSSANPQPGLGPNGQPAQQQALTFPGRPAAMPTNGGGIADSGMPQDGQSADGQPISIPSGSSPESGQPDSPSPAPGGSRGRYGTAADPNYPGNPGGPPQDPQAMLQQMLQSQANPQQGVQQPPNPGAPGGTTPTPSAFGTNTQNTGQNNQLQAGGGIAGVASKAAGRTIKVLKDQTDRSLWEFVYDMQAEANANAPGLGNANGTAPNGAINGPQTNQGNSSSFGSTNQNNSFGSSFGSAPTQLATPPPSNQ